MAETKVDKKATQVEATYTREALATSKKYREKCDIIMIALESDKQYTMSEAETKIKEFLSNPLREEINGKGDK